MSKLTRREVLVGAAGAGLLGGCGLAGSGPEEDVKNSHATPIHLTATGTVSAGTSAGVNSAALRNPYGLPTEVHEIKWALRNTSNYVDGAGIACSLQLGDHQLTNGFVRISGFCKSVNLAEAEEAWRTSSAGYAEFVMRLAHPIFVPAGATLIPRFQWLNAVSGDVAVRISYAGRTLPKDYRPSRLVLPWITSYTSKPMANDVANTDTSDEPSLQNPWPHDLSVSRLVGRVLSFDTTNGITEFFGTNVAAPTNYLDLIRLKIARSDGFDIVRDATKFGLIFDVERRAFELGGSTLPPGAYYKVDLEKVAGDQTNSQVFVVIGMIGYREIGVA